MTNDHWFWFSVMVAVLGWYSSITVYVTFKGARDIRQMLRQLQRKEKGNPPDQTR